MKGFGDVKKLFKFQKMYNLRLLAVGSVKKLH